MTEKKGTTARAAPIQDLATRMQRLLASRAQALRTEKKETDNENALSRARAVLAVGFDPPPAPSSPLSFQARTRASSRVLHGEDSSRTKTTTGTRDRTFARSTF